MKKLKFSLIICMLIVGVLNYTISSIEKMLNNDIWLEALAQIDYDGTPEHNETEWADPDCDGTCTMWTYKSLRPPSENYGGYETYDKFCPTSSNVSGNAGTTGGGGSAGSSGYYVIGCGWNSRAAHSGSGCWDESC